MIVVCVCVDGGDDGDSGRCVGGGTGDYASGVCASDRGGGKWCV